MKITINQAARLLVGAAIVGLTGCTPHPAPAPAPSTVTVTVPAFSVTPVQQTQESQSKGGITISLAAASGGDAKVQDWTSYTQYKTMLEDNLHVHVRKTDFAVVAGSEGTLKLLVTLNNQMPRVFHGAGTIVQFKIGGQSIPVNQANYADLQNLIIPPASQEQIAIYGPALDSIPDKGTLGVFFYDVVTNQNDAGVVTEKQNFTWYYEYSKTNKTIEVHAPQITKVRMTADEYSQAKAESEQQRLALHVDKAQLDDEMRQMKQQPAAAAAPSQSE
jgi:hypothetical protein